MQDINNKIPAERTHEDVYLKPLEDSEYNYTRKNKYAARSDHVQERNVDQTPCLSRPDIVKATKRESITNILNMQVIS